MRLHAYLPSETPTQDADEVVQTGVLAEELGYHGVWLPDHPLPYYEYRHYFGGVWEPLVMLAAVAARTSRVRIGTGVIVAAMRNPFAVAKQAATIDRLSAGRLELGIGVGIVPREYLNMGADYGTRGARTDEIIRLFRHLFKVGRGPFDGKFYPLGEEAVFAPEPAQGDRVPIWIGGRTDAAWRRAARTGDGWLCAMTEPGDFERNVGAMRELAGRPVLAGARVQIEDVPSVEQALDVLETWRAAGTDDFFLWFGDPAGYAKRMEVFAEAHRRMSPAAPGADDPGEGPA